jgi:hypothetical protein
MTVLGIDPGTDRQSPRSTTNAQMRSAKAASFDEDHVPVALAGSAHGGEGL